jgi:1,4-dihydroxy-2-naphthoate octaprenyltransferase
MVFQLSATSIRTYIRAFRLPFLTASIFPFIAGSFIKRDGFNPFTFFLGLTAVMFMHVGANLINDYADSKSGADWQDKNFYKFFGGSKLIQEGILSEKFYLKASLICLCIAFVAVGFLAIIFKNATIIAFYLLILFFGFSYSCKPLQLSYHRLGEFVIFFLFGPATVCGGYFIQKQIFPTLVGFMLSLPFGFLTTAILFSNEIPDFSEDVIAGKYTWVSVTGEKNAYLVYYLLEFLGFFFIILNYKRGYVGWPCLLSLVLLIPVLKAGGILKSYSQDKARLMQSSKLTIMVQTIVSIFLIIGMFYSPSPSFFPNTSRASEK